MRPPPTTRSPSKKTLDCPGVTARAGSSNRNSTPSPPTAATVHASAGRPVPDLNLQMPARLRRGGQPVQLPDRDATDFEQLPRPHHDLARRGPDLENVVPFRAPPADALALPDGKPGVAAVPPQNAAPRVHDGAGREGGMGRQQLRRQQVPVVSGGHEADLLGFRLVGGLQPQLPRPRANLRLGEFAQREVKETQEVGREPPEKVGLVLGAVPAA